MRLEKSTLKYARRLLDIVLNLIDRRFGHSGLNVAVSRERFRMNAAVSKVT